MPTALLFPGQGSHTDDMRDRVAALRPDLLERVGADVFARAAHSTAAAQPAIFCASLAGYAELGVRPDAAAGHSLGEIAALTAAGVLDEGDALALVGLRGRLMEAAPAGGMLAVLAREEIDAAAIAERHGVVVANDNAPGQIVLSGEAGPLQAAAEELQTLGLRTLGLSVAGAFHSPLMAGTVEPFAIALQAVEVREPAFPVYSCASAAPFTDVRAELAAALTSPVRWRATIEALAAAGIDRFVETGPGRVLTKLTPRILDRSPAHA